MKTISTPGSIEIIDPKNVLYIDSEKGQTRIHLIDQKVIITTIPFTDFDSSMYVTYYRIHTYCTINLSKLKRYHREGIAELQGEVKLPVSRRRRNSLISRLTYLVDNNLME